MVACEFSKVGDYAFLVKGDKDDGVDAAKNGDGGCWDCVVDKPAIHDYGLAYEECGELRIRYGESNGGSPYWKHSNHGFQFLYLCHCAYPPSVPFVLWICYYRCFVQKPDKINQLPSIRIIDFSKKVY